MFYLFTLSGIALCAFAALAVYAVFKVSAEQDERVDQMHKQRNEF